MQAVASPHRGEVQFVTDLGVGGVASGDLMARKEVGAQEEVDAAGWVGEQQLGEFVTWKHSCLCAQLDLVLAPKECLAIFQSCFAKVHQNGNPGWVDVAEADGHQAPAVVVAHDYQWD